MANCIRPIVIVAKILMQKLWRIKTGWDSLVPDGIFREWQQFQQQLPLIAQIRIPRWLGINNCRNITLHGFADASESAYGQQYMCVLKQLIISNAS